MSFFIIALNLIFLLVISSIFNVVTTRFYSKDVLEKKKYKFINKKDDSKDNIIGELGITITYNDFIGFNTSYQIKKSLNTSDYIDKVEIGVKFKF